jgi:hypothetical protein
MKYRGLYGLDSLYHVIFWNQQHIFTENMLPHTTGLNHQTVFLPQQHKFRLK